MTISSSPIGAIVRGMASRTWSRMASACSASLARFAASLLACSSWASSALTCSIAATLRSSVAST
eukprot:12406845-Alexandrium_andersonii.AAC.1